MRFFADGPNIPDELLNAHEDGRVVFFCGAGGVSMGYAGLPDFIKLTEQTLRKLGSAEESDELRLFKKMLKTREEMNIRGVICAGDPEFSGLTDILPG